MATLKLLISCLLAVLSGSTLAQSFPSKPITLICPYPTGGPADRHLRAFAQISFKYLAQPVMVENRPGAMGTLAPAEMARTAPPDGYILSHFPITAFRVPHMTRVTWDPLKDFTYIIGLAGFDFGIAVRSDSQFKSLKDLIDFAKANPGTLLYGAPEHGGTPHLAMEELGLKTGARFLRVPVGSVEAAKALIDGRIRALSGATGSGRYFDSGAFRLLVTFGERRTRWNAPTAMELGLDILSYGPFGIVGPKGMDPKLTKLLHDAFKQTLDDPEYDRLMTRLDMVDWYKSSEDYAEWAVDQFKFQRALIERTIGLPRN
jgi:tripartite-type tricarboxylate transporter receptor subunit TctC